MKGVAIESCGEAVREMVTQREPEQIQTVYLAQETQGGGDDVMTEVEEPAGTSIMRACQYSEL